ncbi:MAG: SRPBCC family protein [Gammaproteobacteria bacterium]
MKLLIYVSLLWLNVWVLVYATEVSVRYEDKSYHLHAEFNVDATSERVMEVLTDFENIADLNPAIIESELQPSSIKDSVRVRTVVKDCILFFCKSITRVEDIDQIKNEKLEAFIVPMLSDLRSGSAVWRLAQHPAGTAVKYEASMQPKFWIPPVIRSYVLTKKFKKRVIESVELLQKKAQE